MKTNHEHRNEDLSGSPLFIVYQTVYVNRAVDPRSADERTSLQSPVLEDGHGQTDRQTDRQTDAMRHGLGGPVSLRRSVVFIIGGFQRA